MYWCPLKLFIAKEVLSIGNNVIVGANSVVTKDSFVDALKYTLEHHAKLKYNAMIMRQNSPYTMCECAKRYLEYFVE